MARRTISLRGIGVVLVLVAVYAVSQSDSFGAAVSFLVGAIVNVYGPKEDREDHKFAWGVIMFAVAAALFYAGRRGSLDRDAREAGQAAEHVAEMNAQKKEIADLRAEIAAGLTNVTKEIRIDRPFNPTINIPMQVVEHKSFAPPAKSKTETVYGAKGGNRITPSNPLRPGELADFVPTPLGTASIAVNASTKSGRVVEPQCLFWAADKTYAMPGAAPPRYSGESVLIQSGVRFLQCTNAESEPITSVVYTIKRKSD